MLCDLLFLFKIYLRQHVYFDTFYVRKNAVLQWKNTVTHLYNIVIFICDIYFYIYVIGKVFLSYLIVFG